MSKVWEVAGKVWGWVKAAHMEGVSWVAAYPEVAMWVIMAMLLVWVL